MSEAIGARNAGYDIIAQKALSDHPDESHLSVVLGVDGEREKAVTWRWNADTGAFFHGNYFDARDQDDWLKQAASDFHERGK